jgi:nicotinamidase/pyrazinamidase
MKNYLIIVDVQNDFTRELGTLYVKGAKSAIKNINKIFNTNVYDKIIATQDWHPTKHVSFASTWKKKPFVDTIYTDYGEQELWPIHCIKNSWGSEIDDNLRKEYIDIIWRKGTRFDLDSYSAFLENDRKTTTGLDSFLTNEGFFVCQVDIVGIATDVCVYNTAKDCYNMVSHDVRVLLNGCAGVNKENTEKRLQELKDIGVKIIE